MSVHWRRLVVDALVLGLVLWMFYRLVAFLVPYPVSSVVVYTLVALGLVGVAWWRLRPDLPAVPHPVAMGVVWAGLFLGLDWAWARWRFPEAQLVYPVELVAFYLVAGLVPVAVWFGIRIAATRHPSAPA